MPSYHFEVNGPVDGGDARVIQFNDHAEAKREALKLAGTLVANASETFWDKPEWMLIVRDDAGMTLFQLQVLGAEGPAEHNLSREGFGEGTFDQKKKADEADIGIDGC
ncbi:MAG: hypothetical protein H0T82_10995 [Sphingomonas sp.]|nr:hypothetical protein [Sphingomonas sp.]